ncbi:MAG TPA: hypothetical protein VIJ62_13685 [Rhizomicrobium sp.]
MFGIRQILMVGCIAPLGACIASGTHAAEQRELTSRIFMPTADQMTLNDVVADHAQSDGPPRTVFTRTSWKSNMMIPAAVASLVEIRHGKAMLLDYRPQKLPGADVALGVDGKGIHLIFSFPPTR